MNIPCRVRSSETRNFSGSQKTRLSCVRQDELVELRMPWANIDLRLVHIWAPHPSPPWCKMSMMAQAQFLSFGFVDQQHPLRTCWKWQLWTPPQTGWIRLCTKYPSDLQVHHSPMTLSFPLISSSCPTLKYSHPKTLKGIRSFLGFPCFIRWSLSVIRNFSPALSLLTGSFQDEKRKLCHSTMKKAITRLLNEEGRVQPLTDPDKHLLLPRAVPLFTQLFIWRNDWAVVWV